MLGPARFSHIETCAEEVCKKFKQSEELQDCITTLQTLDDLLAENRQQLAALTADSSANGKAPSSTGNVSGTPSVAREPKKMDYTNLDVVKAKRLIQARENSIKSVKAAIAKKSIRQICTLRIRYATGFSS